MLGRVVPLSPVCRHGGCPAEKLVDCGAPGGGGVVGGGRGRGGGGEEGVFNVFVGEALLVVGFCNWAWQRKR